MDETPLLYRSSALGVTLMKALDKLRDRYDISREMYEEMLKKFDEALRDGMEVQKFKKLHATLKGPLQEYNFIDDSWRFIIQRPEIESVNSRGVKKRIEIDTPTVQIIANDVTKSKRKKRKRFNLDDEETFFEDAEEMVY
eukprot:TRINITY_DN135161_c0_g1_i1.p1 TRINITY_DN135161_c0_g1~~TRINITY_DN135161_c0_g1_i1.p1  ORF type:complete len:140 (-),score=36.13 TRINITY_DN135161_c0_g1_i1:339-758(-)